MGRPYSADLAARVARAAEACPDVDVHAGFERVELSLDGMVTLGFADEGGLWLAVREQEAGAVHAGRFGRAYRWVADADTAEDTLRSWIDLAAARANSALASGDQPLRAARPAFRKYLKLMNADHEALAELARALETPEVRAAMPRMWESRNWRPHVVACAAACVTSDTAGLDMAWMAFDRYSWAAPQLAVTLRLVDPGFRAAAEARLAAAGELDDVWPKPLDRWVLDAKSRAALEAMCAGREHDARAEGARLAEVWRGRIERFLAGA